MVTMSNKFAILPGVLGREVASGAGLHVDDRHDLEPTLIHATLLLAGSVTRERA